MTSSPQRYIYIDPDHLKSPTSSPARSLFGWLRRKPTAPMLSPKIQVLVQALE